MWALMEQAYYPTDKSGFGYFIDTALGLRGFRVAFSIRVPNLLSRARMKNLETLFNPESVITSIVERIPMRFS